MSDPNLARIPAVPAVPLPGTPTETDKMPDTPERPPSLVALESLWNNPGARKESAHERKDRCYAVLLGKQIGIVEQVISLQQCRRCHSIVAHRSKNGLDIAPCGCQCAPTDVEVIRREKNDAIVAVAGRSDKAAGYKIRGDEVMGHRNPGHA